MKTAALRVSLGAACTLCALLLTIPASAEIRSSLVHIEQNKGGVIVQIDNLQVDTTHFQTRGDRIFVDLPKALSAQQVRLSGDRTVKMVEIKDGSHPRITIKLRHGRNKTRSIGLAATVENVSNGVLIHVPRWPIPRASAKLAGAALVAGDADTETSTAASEGRGTSVTDAPHASSQGSPSQEDIGDSAAAPGQDHDISMVGRASEAKEPPIATAKYSSDDGVSFGLMFGILLMLGGAGLLVWRSRKNPNSKLAPPMEGFRVIASKQLGGKSKVVWMSVGSREMVVSVGESGTQLISEWDCAAAPPLGAGGQGQMHEVSIRDAMLDDRSSGMDDDFAMGTPVPPMATVASAKRMASDVYDFRSTLSAAAKAQGDIASHLSRRSTPMTTKSPNAGHSPSVSGLLRLRDLAPKVNTAVATGDPRADAQWARELLKETRASLRRRMD